jgi:hypothetical protein
VHDYLSFCSFLSTLAILVYGPLIYAFRILLWYNSKLMTQMLWMAKSIPLDQRHLSYQKSGGMSYSKLFVQCISRGKWFSYMFSYGRNRLSRPEHLSSSSLFSGIHVAQSLGFCVVFCARLFIVLFLSFFSSHSSVWSSGSLTCSHMVLYTRKVIGIKCCHGDTGSFKHILLSK